MIENMHHLISSFSKEKVPALAVFVDQAKEKYHENLNLYIKLVLRRPLARLLVRLSSSYRNENEKADERNTQDFFQGLETLLRTTPPTEVSLHSAYTKPSLRRALSSLSSKDLKKAIEVLYKRVDKHFAGDSPSGGIAAAVGVGGGGGNSAEEAEVLRSVWKACEDDVGRAVEGWKGLITRCYPVSSHTLLFPLLIRLIDRGMMSRQFLLDLDPPSSVQALITLSRSQEEKGLEFSREEVSTYFSKAQTS